MNRQSKRVKARPHIFFHPAAPFLSPSLSWNGFCKLTLQKCTLPVSFHCGDFRTKAQFGQAATSGGRKKCTIGISTRRNEANKLQESKYWSLWPAVPGSGTPMMRVILFEVWFFFFNLLVFCLLWNMWVNPQRQHLFNKCVKVFALLHISWEHDTDSQWAEWRSGQHPAVAGGWNAQMHKVLDAKLPFF